MSANKAAVVTGASAGLGACMARELDRRGWRVILVARRQEALDRVARELADARTIALDLSRREDCHTLFSLVADEPVRLAVNNAGMGALGPFAQLDLGRELSQFDLDAGAALVLTKLFCQRFARQGEGRVLNVASTAAFCPGPLFAGYYAAKSYVYRLSRAVNQELGQGGGVGVSVFCPGALDTGFDAAAGAQAVRRGLDPRRAAYAAIEGALRGRAVIYPNLPARLAAWSGKLLPEGLTMAVTRRVQEKKLRQK